MTELISHFQKDNKPSTIFILMKTQNSFQPSMQNMEQSNCGSAKNNQTAFYDITADCNKQILQSIPSYFSRKMRFIQGFLLALISRFGSGSLSARKHRIRKSPSSLRHLMKPVFIFYPDCATTDFNNALL